MKELGLGSLVQSGGSRVSDTNEQLTRPKTRSVPSREFAGTCETMSTPKPRHTAIVLISAAGPVHRNDWIHESEIDAPAEADRSRPARRWMAQLTPMPSVMAANIDVATPSGIPDQPMTANFNATASRLGIIQ
jgi:hypothetical protein